MKRLLLPALATALSLTPPAHAAPVPNGVLTGRIADWPAGQTGEVRLVPRVKMFGSDTAAPLATAQVDGKGNFTLTLPAAAQLGAVLPASSDTWTAVTACPDWTGQQWCQRSLALAPAARVNLFDLQVYSGGVRLPNLKLGSAPLANPAAGLVNTYLAYAAGPTTITGEHYTRTTKTVWDAAVPAGWSWLTETYGSVNPESTLWPASVTAGPVPDTFTYYLAALAADVTFKTRFIFNVTVAGHEVTAVTPGSGAEKAGLRVGDLIVALDGRDVTRDNSALFMQSFDRPPGTVIVFTVQRGSDTLTLPVTLDGKASDFEH